MSIIFHRNRLKPHIGVCKSHQNEILNKEIACNPGHDIALSKHLLPVVLNSRGRGYALSVQALDELR